MPLFQNASYAASVAAPTDPYPVAQAEIAFAGRSNAGKSSAINTLAARRRLAFVSKTPGRTQMINFFALGEARYLVDLPGYGYAKVPDRIQSQWDGLLSTYLKHRDALRGIALIMDIRRPFTDLDLRLLDFFDQAGKPVHVLLTKADKLSQSVANTALREARHYLEQRPGTHTVQLFSSLKRQGIEEAEGVFSRWLDLPDRQSTRPVKLPGASPRPKNKPRGFDARSPGPNKKPRAKGE
jgi:GTP-binding protein